MFQDSEIISASDLGIACVQKKGSKGGPSINICIYIYIYLGVQAGRSFNGLSGDKKNIILVGISFMINNSKGPINLMIFELQGTYDMFTYGNHLDLQQNPGLG